MERINLTDKKIVESAGHSSKGNQPKWCFDNKWYKADSMGYEALSEILVSKLLEKTNVTGYVKYYPVEINYNNRILNGCYSYNFLKKGYELIPLERLHRAYFGTGLHNKLTEIEDTTEKIKYTVNFVEKYTNLKDFGKYLATMIEIDAFFLNEDRHTNNIAVIRNPENNEYSLCPYFDNGLALLSDTNEFWLGGDINKHIMRITAKPFGTFDKMTQAVYGMYGKNLKINFTLDDVDNLLKDLKNMYPDKIIDRVRNIIKIQFEKYTLQNN